MTWSPSESRETSEQPGEELRCEKREPAAKDDARNLPFGPSFAKHEHQPTDHDSDERERSGQWAGKCEGEVVRRALPRGLRERHRWNEHENCHRETRAPNRWHTAAA